MAALLTSLGISIHAPREGGDMFLRRGSRHFLISIHAPREGGDDPEDVRALNCEISIHAPREGGDLTVKRIGKIKIRFQSTPPARGATLSSRNQYMAQIISIHAPREGGDQQNTHSQQQDRLFQSTPPARGATVKHIERRCYADHFNPRPPRGGRLKR